MGKTVTKSFNEGKFAAKDCIDRRILLMQSRRRVLKSGTAIERQRRSARAEGSSRGRAREGDFSPSRKGDLPRENF